MDEATAIKLRNQIIEQLLADHLERPPCVSLLDFDGQLYTVDHPDDNAIVEAAAAGISVAGVAVVGGREGVRTVTVMVFGAWRSVYLDPVNGRTETDERPPEPLASLMEAMLPARI